MEAKKGYRRQIRWDRIGWAALAAVLLLAGLIWGLTALFGRKEKPSPPADSDTADVQQSQSTPDSEPPAPTVDLTAWNLVLVNAQNPLPEGFTLTTGTLTNSLEVDERILEDLNAMLAAAKEQGVGLIVCSAYRDLERQNRLHLAQVNSYLAEGLDQAEAEAKACTEVPPAGKSEHNTGLAVDIVTPEYQMLNDGYAETPAAAWLAANAPEYGFILRFPAGKEDVTGIYYQPWHFRYVGKDLARTITDSGLCLEEWLFLQGSAVETGGESIADSQSTADSQSETGSQSETAASFGGGTAAPAEDPR